RWVRYDVEVKEADTGELTTLHFERPVYRQITVRGAGGEDYRPVVKRRMCIVNGIYVAQFPLRARSDMTYRALPGRRTIEHIGLIDVSSTFLLPLECPEQASEEERQRQQKLKEDPSLIDESQIDQPSEPEEEDDEQEGGEPEGSKGERPATRCRGQHHQPRRQLPEHQGYQRRQRKNEIRRPANGGGPHRLIQRRQQKTHHSCIHPRQRRPDALTAAQPIPERHHPDHQQKRRQ